MLIVCGINHITSCISSPLDQDGVLIRERLEKDLHDMRHSAVPAAASDDDENNGDTNDSKITEEVVYI